MQRLFVMLITTAFLVGCDQLMTLTGRPPGGGSDGGGGGGSNGGGDNGGGTGTTGSAKLRAFESEDELTSYFTGEIMSRSDAMFAGEFVDEFRGGDGGLPAGPADTDDSFDLGTNTTAQGEVAESPPQPVGVEGGASEAPQSDGNDFSQTTIQEAGVDEADIVKTDGTLIYVIDGGTLRIIGAKPTSALSVMSEVELEGFGREIYLLNGRVVTLTQTFGGYFFGDTIAIADLAAESDVIPAPEPAIDTGGGVREGGVAISAQRFDALPIYERPQTIVTVIDVSAADTPRILSTTRFDGTSSSSRVIDGVLHLVLANFQNFYFDVLPALGRPELSLREVDASQLLPSYTQTTSDGNESEGAVLTWEDMYRPDEPDGFGVVSVVSMNVAGDSSFSAVGVVAEPGLIYSSRNALYLTNTNYDFTGLTRESTTVFKFAYHAAGSTPVAAGSVPGRILNQYSMSEHNSFLRVATTVRSAFDFNGNRLDTANNVYVMEEAEGDLNIIGALEKIAPGETIQSARFVGDRGYLVTFEQIDPLFTLDMVDPLNPIVVGELKVPGFSTLIIPMDADHLLTVGRYIPEDSFFFRPWGVQLSIFDVSDFANPTLAHTVIFGEDTGAESEALHNPKALTFFAAENLVALPISIFEDRGFTEDDIIFFDTDFDENREDSTGSGSTDGVVVEQPPTAVPIDGNDVVVDIDEPVPPSFFVPGGYDGLVVLDVTAEGGFTELGRLNTRFVEGDQAFFYPSFTRGVFIGEDVYAVTDKGVRAAPRTDVNSAPFQLITGDPSLFFRDDFDPIVGGSGQSGSPGIASDGDFASPDAPGD